MKTKFFSPFILMLLLWNVIPFTSKAQTSVSFTGLDNRGQRVELHHVVVRNLTRDWSVTLTYPDTTFQISGTGVEPMEDEYSRSPIMRVVPNPFEGRTSVIVSLPYSDKVSVNVVDMNGHIVAQLNRSLQSGVHQFDIDVQVPQTYMLNFKTSRDNVSAKMINVRAGGDNRIAYVGESVMPLAQTKSILQDVLETFEIGDRMQYVGYMSENGSYVYSDTVERDLTGDDLVTLTFPLWVKVLEPRHFMDTTLQLIPDGIECNGNCSAQQVVVVEGYPATDFVESAEDIQYVRLKLEHSFVGDVCIRLHCPNGMFTTIMKKNGSGSGQCASQLPSSSLGWVGTGATGAFFGAAVDDSGAGCTPTPMGVCWNYCWSEVENQGYSYANTAHGYVYESGVSGYPIDSTDVSSMSQVYHPEVSFDNLVGCPLNGAWAIDVLDAGVSDNGYLQEFELVLREDTVYHYAPQYISTPKVATLGVSYMSNTRVECMGNVTDEGGLPVTERGVCWSTTTQNPTIDDSHQSAGQGLGTFTVGVTFLVADQTYYVRAYALNALGVSYGEQKMFTYTLDTACVLPAIDVDGNVYDVVKIGQQCWMRENMRATHFPDGTEITEFTTSLPYTWTPGRWTLLDANVFGYLYNWPAAMYGASIGDSVLVQGICPNGWHLPSGTEWGMLISHMESQSQYHCSGNSANIAKALAADQYWMTSSESCAVGNDLSANNATGFSMLPAGEWELHNGQCTNFWTSSYQGLSSNGIYHKAQTMELMYFMPRLSTNTRSHNEVLSVRCLRNY